MEETADKKRERPRLTLDVDTDLLADIKRVPNHREFCIRAIREALRPTIRFNIPMPRQEWPLDDLEGFLSDGNEIWMLGVTLNPIHQEAFYGFLYNKIVEERVSMTFMIMDPKIDNTDPSYALLNKVYPPSVGEESLEGRLQKTCERLRTLYHESQQAQVPMRVLGIRDVPTVGLTIVNPFPGHCRIRVSMYLDMYPNERHPYWEIDSGSQEGRDACDVFLRHFGRMSQEARVISAAWTGESS